MRKRDNKEFYNEYMRKYMLEKYHKKRAKLIELLGGKCMVCGSVNQLEFDHIDPNTKSFTIAQLNTMAYDKAVEECKKCQLLCKPCHNTKTILEKGFQEVKGKDIHGTISSYKYCRCEICKNFYKEYNKNNRKIRPRCRKKNCNGCKIHVVS